MESENPGEGQKPVEKRGPIKLAVQVFDNLQPQDFVILPGVDKNGQPLPDRKAVAMHTGLKSTKTILDLEKSDEGVIARLQRSLDKGSTGPHKLDRSSYDKGVNELEHLLGSVSSLDPNEQSLALAASIDHSIHTILSGRKGVYSGMQNMAPGRQSATVNPYEVKYVQVVQGGLPTLGKRR